MKGELHYKDIHGRVWIVRMRILTGQWTAETLDVGHTDKPHKAEQTVAGLLASIDREAFRTVDIPMQYSDPERVDEIHEEIDRLTEYPGMVEPSDLSGGWADSENGDNE